MTVDAHYTPYELLNIKYSLFIISFNVSNDRLLPGTNRKYKGGVCQWRRQRLAPQYLSPVESVVTSDASRNTGVYTHAEQCGCYASENKYIHRRLERWSLRMAGILSARPSGKDNRNVILVLIESSSVQNESRIQNPFGIRSEENNILEMPVRSTINPRHDYETPILPPSSQLEAPS